MEEVKRRIQAYIDSKNTDPHVLSILNAMVDVLDSLVMEEVVSEPVKEEALPEQPKKWEKK